MPRAARRAWRRCRRSSTRATPWCALGQTTAEADRALRDYGAAHLIRAYGLGGDSARALDMENRLLGEHLDSAEFITRARELAQEGNT